MHERGMFVCIIALTIIFASSVNVNVSANTVSLTFSDGYSSHLAIAQRINSLGLNATFFLNSNNLAFKSGWLNVFDVNLIVSLGLEIGGHTLDNIEIDKVSSPTILEQVCRDRATLFANGWIATSFHYPR